MNAKRTEFTMVARRTNARRSGAWLWATLVAVVAVAGFAAAAALTVKQRADTSAVAAERLTIGEDFLLEASTLWPAMESRGALGVLGAAVELTPDLTRARTALQRDHWVYEVVVKEMKPDSITSGIYAITLHLDEQAVGTIHVKQEFPLNTTIEGVRAQFSVGQAVAPSSLYYVVVRPVVETGPLVDYTVKSKEDGSLVWVGVGGAIDGQDNPTLTMAKGATLRLNGRNGDGVPHNLAIKNTAGAIVAGPTPQFSQIGSGELLTFAPSAAGSFTYYCQLHPTTMKGTLTVSA